MRYLLAIIFALFLFNSKAHAGTTIVEDFRGTIQNVTATGVQTVSLGANTTTVRFNSASDIYVVGMDGGYDGRIVLFINAGAGNALFYNEHSSASSSPAKILLDSNTGYRTLYNNSIGSFGIATYDNSTQRWRVAILGGFNTGGPLAVNGDFSVAGNAAIVGAFSAASATLSNVAGYLLTLKSLTSGNDTASLRWQNSSGTDLFSMSPNYNNTSHDWYLYDHVNARTALLVNNTGMSFLSFGTSYGGVQYAESGDELGLFASGLVRVRLTGNALKIGTHPYYQKRTSATTNTSLACTETTSEAMGTDAMDARGSFTTGTGQTGSYNCVLTFGVPWDLSTNVGKPICTANTSDVGVAVAVSAMTDHEVTFTLSAPGNVTVYYHCDGLIPAP